MAKSRARRPQRCGQAETPEERQAARAGHKPLHRPIYAGECEDTDYEHLSRAIQDTVRLLVVEDRYHDPEQLGEALVSTGVTREQCEKAFNSIRRAFAAIQK